ncbi:lytic transglycosylase domain-containing protein [Bacillus sp. AK031]
MNIQALKTMIELQALQNFNSTTAPTETNSGTSLFQQMLNETLSSHVNQQPIQEKLGSVNQLFPLLNNGNFLMSKTAASYMSKAETLSSNNKSDSSIDSIISKAAELYKLPRKLISAVISQESNFNSNAVSHAGASGLMQLMPATARSLGVTDIFDPEQNILAGTKYLRQMMDKYDGNLEMALAAYNAGPGNVDKYSGIPPFKETIQYVQKVSQKFYA